MPFKIKLNMSSSNYKDLYKKSVDLGEQQKLRQLKLLHEQKQRRQLHQDVWRHVQDSGEDDDEAEDDDVPSCSKAPPKPRKKRTPTKNNTNNNNKKGQHFKLQQSEWLRHHPENLCDWLLLPCPVGKRCLVIATNGRTKVHNKAGRIIKQLRTLLPGDGHMQKSKTVLDCVYVQELDTFYVLDAITFGQQQLLDCEASFRFFWLHSRFDEQGELSQVSKRNEKPFKLVNYVDFEDASAVDSMLQKYPQWEDNQPTLDGLLFYHKESSYTCGTTPLVCWLFAYMVPDVLNLPVNTSYIPPEDYQPGAVVAYMDEFDKKLLAQRQQYKKREKTTEANTSKEQSTPAVMDQELEDEMEEFADLRSLLDHERRLELGEFDMDCTPAPSAVGSSC